MRYIKIILLLLILYVSCKSSKEKSSINTITYTDMGLVGGGCDGCELMYVDMPEMIFSEHTSIGWQESSHQLMITGKVMKLDGRTPAPDVVIYYWHTDTNGIYSPGADISRDAKAHGALRGWVKSDANGNYTIKTSRPGYYPNEDMPQHIHLSIKEPSIENEYFADLYFDDDPKYLKYIKKYKKYNRAGTEVLRVVLDGSIQLSEHNIILGLNIPNYPILEPSSLETGLKIGEDQPSFTPFHAHGPDKGTRTCPVCKYGRYHGIILFVGSKPNWSEIEEWLLFLERESQKREKYLKTYFVYGNPNEYFKITRYEQLGKLGAKLEIQNTALTFVPSLHDQESETDLNMLRSDISNAVIIYKHRTIVEKMINVRPSEHNFMKIRNVLDQTKGLYFDLKEPHNH